MVSLDREPPIYLCVLLRLRMSKRNSKPSPIVERFARMQDPHLAAGPDGPAKQRHCRQVTQAWCVFFVLNGLVAGVLAFAAPTRVWAIYSGGVAYALMGAMFAGEYVLRKARFREYGRGPQDWLLRRVFPPREGSS